MALLLVLFFCSGACGLAYQVLWMRQLSLVFGVTAYAASTVLAAFMAGLAMGSWLAGPLLARIKRPLRAFGLAEIAIGGAAVLTPAALSLTASIYRAVYAASPDSFLLQTAARFVCAFVVLLVPTILMGLTLPLLSASSLVRGVRASTRIGALYALNTAGAVCGALLTGFVLIGAMGMRQTFLAAAAVNTLAGIVAILFDRWLARQPESSGVEGPPEPGLARPVPQLEPPRPRIVWAVMAASGFGALALEVVWFRVLTQYVDATTYAFTSMLAVVLVGIAVGSAIVSPLLARDRDYHGWLAANQLATGILVLVGVMLIVRDQAWLVEGMGLRRGVFLAVLLPCLLMGVSFPLLLKLGVPPAQSLGIEGGDERRGRMVGRFYGVNVLGAIFGSLGGGFLILPMMGTRLALLTLGALFLTTGLALCVTHRYPARMAPVAVIGVALFAAFATRMPDPLVAAALAHTGSGSADTLFMEEGVQTTVSVHPTQTGRTLFVNGLHQANDTEDMVRLHRAIGLLPMVLHKKPTSALVIGLGGGATAGAVTQHGGGAKVQVVELSDSVRKAAAFFSHINYDVLSQSSVRLRVDDGRNFLLLSGERFDVITADVIQPVHAGAGGLYSREYFQLVRRSLNPGGLVMQWISKQEKSHYFLIMRTFLAVFPNATLWLDGNLLIGSVEPFVLHKDAFEAQLALPRTREALMAIGLSSYAVLRSWYTAGPTEMAAFVGPGPLLTDDRPLVEYHRSLPREGDLVDLTNVKRDIRDVEP